MPRDKAMAEAD
ncbi:uncharacterized protein ACO6RY_04405 [Pungitius sinensis]